MAEAEAPLPPFRVLGVVVAYNHVGRIREFLDGASRQSMPMDVAVVDNSDKTDVVGALGDRYGKRVPGGPTLPDVTAIEAARQADRTVWLVRHGTNLGPGAGFRTGIRLADAAGYDAAWLLDDDMAPDPACLEDMVRAMDKAGLLRSHLATPRRIDPHPGTEYPSVYVGKDGIEWQVPPGDGPTEIHAAPYSGLLVPRAAFQVDGAIPVDYFIDACDFTMCMRFRRAGFRIYHVGTARAVHESGGQPQRFGKRLFRLHATFRFYYLARNHRYLLDEMFPGRPRARLWFRELRKLALMAAASRGRRFAVSKAIVLGWIDGLRWRKGRRAGYP